MEYEINLIVTVLLGLITTTLIVVSSSRIPAFRCHVSLFGLFSVLVCFVCLLKIFILDKYLPVPDQITFDYRANEIAGMMQHNGIMTLWNNFGTGNKLYPLFLACLYYLFECPQEVTYILNGSLAVLGLLSLVETMAVTTGTTRFPTWFLLIIFASPTMLFFTAANLKEGPNLWAACMALRLCKYNVGKLNPYDLFLGLTGVGVLCLFRAHFAASWILAMAFSTLVTQKKIVLGFCLLGASAGAIPALMYAKPAMFEVLMNDGLMDVAEQHYESNKNRGGSAITYASGAPIPVFSGLALLLFRPYPWEVFDLFSLLTAFDMWIVSGFMLWSWGTTRNKFKLMNNSVIMTALVAMLMLSFFFSYQYNMGLMVRHRIQAFPAIYLLAFMPTLIRLSESRRQQFQHRLINGQASQTLLRQRSQVKRVA